MSQEINLLYSRNGLHREVRLPGKYLNLTELKCNVQSNSVVLDVNIKK